MAKEIRTQALDLLRFPLAVVIVSIHVLISIEGDILSLQQSVGGNFVLSEGLWLFVKAFLARQSVPIYFFISGFVFFIGLQSWDKSRYTNKLKNRKNSLLVPYLLWNSLMLVTTLLAMSLFPDAMTSQGGKFSVISLLSVYWQYDGILTGSVPSSYPIDYPLWFVRDLMILVLLAPLIYKSIKKFGKAIVVLFTIAWVILKFVHIEIIPSIDGLVFFSFGAYMSISGKDMIVEFGKHKRLAAFTFLILGVVHMYVHFKGLTDLITIVKMPMIFAGLYFAYNVAAWLIISGKAKVNKFLSSSSFFIYVSHALICSKVLLACKKILSPSSDVMLVICYLLSIVLTVIILLLGFKLMSKFTPKLLSVLAGRKG